MSKYAAGYIASDINFSYGTQASLSCTFNGTVIEGYNYSNIPVYAPAGFFSKPMPNRMALMHLAPNGTTGYISGFGNEMPDPSVSTNNISGLVEGETGIIETSNFNFNIQAKLDGLKSIFKNSSNDIITTNLAINENIVTILTDIIAEIVALENEYNNFINTLFNLHIHPTPDGDSGPPTVTGNPYNPTSNFTRDKTFLNNVPSQMYINVNGMVIS